MSERNSKKQNKMNRSQLRNCMFAPKKPYISLIFRLLNVFACIRNWKIQSRTKNYHTWLFAATRIEKRGEEQHWICRKMQKDYDIYAVRVERIKIDTAHWTPAPFIYCHRRAAFSYVEQWIFSAQWAARSTHFNEIARRSDPKTNTRSPQHSIRFNRTNSMGFPCERIFFGGFRAFFCQNECD